MKQHVAFFRNLNLGRPRCPTRGEFEGAFLAAGAQHASSFLTNGSIVFTAGPGTTARAVLAGASTLLRESCGLEEPGFLRSMKRLVELVRSDPFSGVDRDAAYACCVTFVRSPRSLTGHTLPEGSRRGDVRLIAHAQSEVLCLSLKLGASPGSPNAWIEKLLGEPATTRNWNTVARLVDKHT